MVYIVMSQNIHQYVHGEFAAFNQTEERVWAFSFTS